LQLLKISGIFSVTTINSVVVRKDDARAAYGDAAAFAGMKFGRVRDVNVNKYFDSWCARYNFKPQTEDFSSFADAFKALDEKKLDALVVGGSVINGYRTVLRFVPRPYYIAFSNNSGAVKQQADLAMEFILIDNPTYEQDLYNKYFGSIEKDIVAFSKSENEYLAQHALTTVAVMRGDPPFSYLDEDGGGAVKGILPDYYAKLAALTGLKFRFQTYASQEEALAAVKSGRADLLGMFRSDIFTAEKSGLVLTKNYYAMNMAQITRVGDRTIESAAVLNRDQAFIKDKLSGIRLECFADVSGCYSALASGSVDAIICELPAATWLLNQHRSSDYRTSNLSALSWGACCLMPAEKDALRSILNKGINASGSAIESVITTDTLQENSVESIIDKLPILWVAGFAVAMLFVALFLVAAVVLLVRRQREKAMLAAINEENVRKEARLSALEKSNDEKNRFFSTISHDMRTPLNAVIGFAQLARKESLPAKASDYISKIEISGNLLLDLINDTLTISKISSGKLELDPEPIQADELFESIMIPIRAAAEKKNITFKADLAGVRKTTILADRLNTQKIFLNLLSNAVKYTPAGGAVEFSVADVSEERAGLELLAVIRDNGIGISGEFLPHIYEPFVQEQRKKTESTGTGLGLSIVKRLVDMMGGQIDVSSKLGCGTTFTLRLHFDETDAAPKTAQTIPVDKSASLEGSKILVCEDNALNMEIDKALLEAKGMTAVSASDGKEGVEAFAGSREGEFDAILMDLRMPVMDGYEAVRTIRAMDRSDAASVPVIAMTADAYDEDVKKCLQAGMDGHVSKPVDPEKLYAALALMLAKRRGGQQASSK
jgi:signal transduction histidine kinase/CheY-like chemotaxis protein